MVTSHFQSYLYGEFDRLMIWVDYAFSLAEVAAAGSSFVIHVL
jgi:hypothetical protein